MDLLNAEVTQVSFFDVPNEINIDGNLKLLSQLKPHFPCKEKIDFSEL